MAWRSKMKENFNFVRIYRRLCCCFVFLSFGFVFFRWSIWPFDVFGNNERTKTLNFRKKIQFHVIWKVIELDNSCILVNWSKNSREFEFHDNKRLKWKESHFFKNILSTLLCNLKSGESIKCLYIVHVHIA